MKRVIRVAVLAGFAGAMATVLLAQADPKVKTEQPGASEGEKPKAQTRPEGEVRREGERERARLRLPEQAGRMDTAVGFTDDQKQKIVEMNKAREAAIRDANAKFQAELLGLMTPEQKAKWDAAMKEREQKEGQRREGERREGDRPAVRPPVEGSVSSGSPEGGNTLQGMLIAKGEDWITVKADGQARGVRLTTTDKEIIAAIGKLTIPSRVKAVWKEQAGGRQIVQLGTVAQVATRGEVEGAVTNKGERWVEVKPADGQAERYMTIGEAKDVVAAIAAVKVGDQVRVTWNFNERKRVVKLVKVGAGQ